MARNSTDRRPSILQKQRPERSISKAIWFSYRTIFQSYQTLIAVKLKAHTSIQAQREHSGLSLRNGFTAYLGLSLVNGFLATVATPEMNLAQLDASTAGVGPHGITASGQLRQSYLPHPSHLTARS